MSQDGSVRSRDLGPGEFPVSPDELRAVMAEFSSGVTVLTAEWQGGLHAMTATAFCSVSLEPPLVLVCVGKGSRFHPVITGAEAWAVSLLSGDQGWLARHFADRERDLPTQFARVPHTLAAHSRAPLPDGTRGWLDCSTYARYDGGDHTIAVGRVLRAGRSTPEDAPLTYHRATFSDLVRQPGQGIGGAAR